MHVGRASRPRPGHGLKDYRALLARGLVRPSKLELYVATPTDRRLCRSPGSARPRLRRLFAVNVDGAALERITYAPGFDGFPMFSPDGRWLAFSSNRSTAVGRADTNIYVARWIEPPLPGGDRAVDRIAKDVAWLASKEREGRGTGTEHIEKRFAALGLRPLGDGRGYSIASGSR